MQRRFLPKMSKDELAEEMRRGQNASVGPELLGSAVPRAEHYERPQRIIQVFETLQEEGLLARCFTLPAREV
jgi:hypothetical protein